MRTPVFIVIEVVVAAALYLAFRFFGNDYIFFASYSVLQFVVLATAWNILGGYCGYVNFGSAGFFAIGAYSSVSSTPSASRSTTWCRSRSGFMHLIFPLPVPVLIVIASVAAGLVGLGTGYLTLRLRGVFFAIATLALAVVFETFIVNWYFVGGSRGAYVIPPNTVPVFGPYIQYLFVLMLIMVIIALTSARLIERSRLGFGFATIRDDELAAEASGVPTLKLKLIATTLSGALMGMAGATVPVLPRLHRAGLGVQPVLRGQLDRHADDRRHHLLGRAPDRRRAARHPAAGRHVTISSAVNLLIVGLFLVSFVIIAPKGIVGCSKTGASQEGEVMTAPVAAGRSGQQALRRLRRARRQSTWMSPRASASA